MKKLVIIISLVSFSLQAQEIDQKKVKRFHRNLNIVRVLMFKRPLKWNNELEVKATKRVREMWFDDHVLVGHSYEYNNYESIAYTYMATHNHIGKLLHDKYVESKGHRKMLLDRKAREVGIASIYKDDAVLTVILTDVELF